MKNPKTTILGILTIVGGAIGFAIHGFTTNNWFDASALATVGAAWTAGIGLIHSADDSKV
jgi:hypothetical protein